MMTTTVELIERHVRRTPDKTAVLCAETRLTYRQLWDRSGEIAGALGARGYARGDTVALLGPGNADFMVAVLGTWRAGLTWTPLDPRLPAERVRHVLTDTRARLVLTTDGGAAPAVPDGVPVLAAGSLRPAAARVVPDPALSGRADDLAYVIYTSGSTGVPKGVCVAHHPLATHLTGAVEAYQLAADDVLLSFSASSFDATVMEMWAVLVAGGTVLLRGHALWTGPQLFERVRAHGVTYVACTTAYFETFFGEELTEDHIAALSGLRVIFFGGEAPSADVVRRWANGPLGHVALCNGYGPTEAVIAATMYWIRQGWDGAGQVPIGSPVPGHETVVLDSAGHEAAPGTSGELYLGGTCVAQGYLGRPDLTEQRFVRLPGREGVHYRTGDLVVYEGGELVFLGRVDRQVKIRGYRIELEEIEVALRGLGPVRNAVVGVERGPAGRDRLVAHVVPRRPADAAALTAELRAGLRAALPVYMVPDTIEMHDELPLGATGKVDRARLLAGAGER
jgi:amino acid adenylation domain-containing protein